MREFNQYHERVTEIFRNMDCEKKTKEEKRVVIKYEGKIGKDIENVKKIASYISDSTYQKILWVAPTNSGKTHTINTLMSMINSNFSSIYCPSKVQNEQNSNAYDMKAVVAKSGHLSDTDVNENIRCSAVYDKAKACEDEIIRRIEEFGDVNPIIYIDECHEISASLDYRGPAIGQLNSLIDTVIENHGTCVYVTATPSRVLNIQFDLIIECVPIDYVPVAKNIEILEVTSDDNMLGILTEQISNLIRMKKIPFVRINDKKLIEKVQRNLDCLGYVSESVTGDDKTYHVEKDFFTRDEKLVYDNNIYHEVVLNNQLPRMTRDGKIIQAYFCTSLLEAGTNITSISGEQDADLVPIFCIPNANHCSPDSVEQLFNRIRYKLNNAMIIIDNTEYSKIIEKTLDEIKKISDVTIRQSSDDEVFVITTTKMRDFNKIKAECNKNDVLFTVSWTQDNHFMLTINKKMFKNLDVITEEICCIAKRNLNIFQNIFENLLQISDEETAYKEMDQILEIPTISGEKNNLHIIKRSGDNIYIDNDMLWKICFDLYLRQYFFSREKFYNDISENLKMPYSKKEVKLEFLDSKKISVFVKNEVINILEECKSEELKEQIINDDIKDPKIKAIEKNEHFKKMAKLVKLTGDVEKSFNIVKNNNAKNTDAEINTLMKKSIGKLNFNEKRYLEKLLRMEEIRWDIFDKKEQDVKTKLQLISDSSYWKLLKKAVESDISLPSILNQIEKSEALEDVTIYIQRSNNIRLLSKCTFDELDELDQLGIAGIEIKEALKLFNNYDVKTGNFCTKLIKDKELYTLQNNLNNALKGINPKDYTKAHAKRLIKSLFNIRKSGSNFIIVGLAKSAA
ncbi:MAG: DEAD/DEAH box helicase family protein [Sulfurospirillaceae bacterium]|nr:DEAD/DEAH box helicase family protein [Sulfurospirillaceae bacterium]